MTMQDVLDRISMVANTLNNGNIKPDSITGMRTLVVCWDHLNETAKMVREEMNKEALKNADNDK